VHLQARPQVSQRVGLGTCASNKKQQQCSQQSSKLSAASARAQITTLLVDQ
jgi:hypothetical protein